MNFIHLYTATLHSWLSGRDFNPGNRRRILLRCSPSGHARGAIRWINWSQDSIVTALPSACQTLGASHGCFTTQGSQSFLLGVGCTTWDPHGPCSGFLCFSAGFEVILLQVPQWFLWRLIGHHVQGSAPFSSSGSCNLANLGWSHEASQDEIQSEMSVEIHPIMGPMGTRGVHQN